MTHLCLYVIPYPLKQKYNKHTRIPNKYRHQPYNTPSLGQEKGPFAVEETDYIIFENTFGKVSTKTYNFGYMKIEEAILYCLASQSRGMRTEQIAEMINRKRLHVRKDGQPVTSNQVYAVICRNPDMFVKAEGRIMLMI